jgi:3-hydroxyisobutyrate dehydrogenase-like beta-hydroxyacid dehydrogenase
MAGNLQKHLSKESYPPLIVYNRTASRADPLKELGVIVATSVEDAVSKAHIVFTCLANDGVVKETYQKITALDIKGKTFCESSTIHPDVTKQTEEAVVAKGAGFVAGPVFGAPAAAIAAQLVFVLTGTPSSVQVIFPFTVGVMGKSSIPMGTDVSKATLLKVTGNTIILGMVEILAEALVFAEKSDLGTDNLDAFIQQMFPNSPFASYSKRMISGEYAPVPPKRPGFQVDLALKDCNHALDLAKECGARLEVVETMERHLKTAKEVGGDNMDISTTYGTLRKEAGLKFSDTID